MRTAFDYERTIIVTDQVKESEKIEAQTEKAVEDRRSEADTVVADTVEEVAVAAVDVRKRRERDR